MVNIGLSEITLYAIQCLSSGNYCEWILGCFLVKKNSSDLAMRNMLYICWWQKLQLVRFCCELKWLRRLFWRQSIEITGGELHTIIDYTEQHHIATRIACHKQCHGTLSPFKHCRVTLKILPERQFRLNETSNHFIQGEGGGRGRGRPLAVGMNQHTA